MKSAQSTRARSRARESLKSAEIVVPAQAGTPFRKSESLRSAGITLQTGPPPPRGRLLQSFPSWLLVLAAGAVAACASTDGEDAELAAARESWRGATYDQVLMAWGTPSQSAVDSHTWLSGDGAKYSGAGVGGVIFPAARCDRTLAFRDGRVVDERWSGDPELCKSYARRK